MAIGRHDVDRVGAGKCGDVLVHKFTQLLAFTSAVRLDAKKKCTGDQYRGGGGEREWKPTPGPQRGPTRRDASLNAGTKGRVGREPLAGGLDRALLLNPVHTLRGTSGAPPQMLAQSARLSHWEFTVQVGIEFFRPGFTDHSSSLYILSFRTGVPCR